LNAVHNSSSTLLASFGFLKTVWKPVGSAIDSAAAGQTWAMALEGGTAMENGEDGLAAESAWASRASFSSIVV